MELDRMFSQNVSPCNEQILAMAGKFHPLPALARTFCPSTSCCIFSKEHGFLCQLDFRKSHPYSLNCACNKNIAVTFARFRTFNLHARLAWCSVLGTWACFTRYGRFDFTVTKQIPLCCKSNPSLTCLPVSHGFCVITRRASSALPTSSTSHSVKTWSWASV